MSTWMFSRKIFEISGTSADRNTFYCLILNKFQPAAGLKGEAASLFPESFLLEEIFWISGILKTAK